MNCIYKIADVVFQVDVKNKYTYNIMKDYLSADATPEFVITVSQRDLLFEEKVSPIKAPEYTYESIAIYRKFIYKLIESYNGFFFHCSAIAVDNQGYMFTAESGTGKSTHRNLWVKNFGDKVTVINDDKPIIRKVQGEFYIYGTPWKGKEGLGTNAKVKAKALCFLQRSKINKVSKIETKEAVLKMMNQVVRPESPVLMEKLLELMDGFLTQVNTYNLCVNMEDDAAITAYNGIK